MLYGYVYGLYDPRTKELRYIGQTVMLLWRRLACHLVPSVLARPSHRTNWLKELLKAHLRPTIEALAEATSQEELDRLEVEFIAAARARGERLVNQEPGGNTPSPEHRAKLAALKRGIPRTEATKAKISAAKKGKKLSLEHREKISSALVGKDQSHIQRRVGDSHPEYRHDISTEDILRRLAGGQTKVEVAQALGVSPTFVHRRLNQAGLRGEHRPRGPRRAWNKGRALTPEHRKNLSLAKQRQRNS